MVCSYCETTPLVAQRKMNYREMSNSVVSDSLCGRDWGQEEKGTTEDEMAGWHHWLDGREFVQ